MSLLTSSAAGSRWIRLGATVADGTTATIYSTPLANLRGQKVIFSIFNNDETKYRTQEVLISRRSADVRYSVYNKLGDPISFSLNVALNGADVEFTVENTESFDLSVVLYRLDVS